MKPVPLILALLTLSACAASGHAPHPHGYGWRDSPGRPYPTALPVPGYDYRFRPDPQGLGRDLPAWDPYGYGYAVEIDVHVPQHRDSAYLFSDVEQSAHVSAGESLTVREGYSEEVYVEGGYIGQATPYAAEPGPRPYESDSALFY